MKKLKYLFLLSLTLCTFTLVSCDDDDEDTFELLPHSEVRGSFNGNEVCDGDTVGPYHVEIYNTSFDTNVIWVDHIWDYGIKVKANADGNNFTIAPQMTTDAAGDTLTVSGNGNVDNGNLTFNFT